MATVKVKLRPSTIEGKAGTIYCQIIHNRVVRQLKTGYKVFSDEWSDTRGVLASNNGNSERIGILSSIQERTNCDLKRLKDIIERFDKRNGQYTADDIIRKKYRMRNGEPLSQKSIFNMVGMFSSSPNYAVSVGRIPVNPYNLFEREERVKRGNEHKREYLTIEELKRMIDTPCKHTVVRQGFLFTCFTGLRVSDVRGLRWCDLSQQDGAYTLGVKMYETEKMVYVPLSKQAIWMPERGGKSGEDYVFGSLPKDYNKYIAAWAKAAGVTKHITHHITHHTADCFRDGHLYGIKNADAQKRNYDSDLRRFGQRQEA